MGERVGTLLLMHRFSAFHEAAQHAMAAVDHLEPGYHRNQAIEANKLFSQLASDIIGEVKSRLERPATATLLIAASTAVERWNNGAHLMGYTVAMAALEEAVRDG